MRYQISYHDDNGKVKYIPLSAFDKTVYDSLSSDDERKKFVMALRTVFGD